MKLGLPSLNALMVFDVAARTQSFKEAAEELHISPPAVSHQIRVLEKELGVMLFKRMNRSIELSKQGERYYREVSPALQQLRQATKQIESHRKCVFSIDTIPFLANNLLIPYIQKFTCQFPALQVSIQSKQTSESLNKDDIYVGLRHGRGRDPGLKYEELTRLFISPVCSTEYVSQHGPIDLEGFARHTRISMSSDSMAWPLWAKHNQVSLTSNDELIVDNYQSVLEAAKQHLGVAMAYYPIPNNAQNDTLLVPIFQDRQCEFDAIYLAYRQVDIGRPEIEAFKTWLMSLFVAL